MARYICLTGELAKAMGHNADVSVKCQALLPFDEP
jgi:hypothetical protein